MGHEHLGELNSLMKRLDHARLGNSRDRALGHGHRRGHPDELAGKTAFVWSLLMHELEVLVGNTVEVLSTAALLSTSRRAAAIISAVGRLTHEPRDTWSPSRASPFSVALLDVIALACLTTGRLAL